MSRYFSTKKELFFPAVTPCGSRTCDSAGRAPEIGHARKPDHNFATLKRKAEITEALAFPRSRVVTIDAGQPLEAVILAARQAVWQALRDRAEGRDG